MLGFDPYKVLTFRDKDVRKVVALEKAKAATEEEAISDPKKAKIFYEYMDSSTVKMAGFWAMTASGSRALKITSKDSVSFLGASKQGR